MSDILGFRLQGRYLQNPILEDCPFTEKVSFLDILEIQLFVHHRRWLISEDYPFTWTRVGQLYLWHPWALPPWLLPSTPSFELKKRTNVHTQRWAHKPLNCYVDFVLLLLQIMFQRNTNACASNYTFLRFKIQRLWIQRQMFLLEEKMNFQQDTRQNNSRILSKKSWLSLSKIRSTTNEFSTEARHPPPPEVSCFYKHGC